VSEYSINSDIERWYEVIRRREVRKGEVEASEKVFSKLRKLIFVVELCFRPRENRLC